MKEIALALALIAALCGAQTDAGARAPRRFALLVGCTVYPDLEPRLHLRGPENDARLLAEVLQRYLDVPPANIAVLAGWDAQRPAARPTRANILAELTRLAGTVRAGDQVVVLLAGHGARQPDTDGDELDGLDEIFLPADVRGWNAEIQTVENAIVDDELGSRIAAIRDAGARVWLLVDSCFSGTMLRGVDDEARERFVAPNVLNIPARAAGTPGADAAERGSLALADTRDIVAMYASRSYHVAGERKLPAGAPDREWHGVLTFLVARCLTRVGAATTFEGLYHQIVAAYPEVWQGTLPLAEGDLALRVRGAGAHSGPLLHVRQEGERLVVDGGTLHDLCEGAVLAIYRPGQRGDAGGLLGHVELTRVQLAHSTARAKEGSEPRLPPLADDLRLCPAEIVELPVASVALRVAFVDASGKALAAPPADVREWFASDARLRTSGGGAADVRVTLADDQARVAVLDSGMARSYRVERSKLMVTLLQIHRAISLIRLAAASAATGDVRGVEAALHRGGQAMAPGESLQPSTPVELQVRNGSGEEREVWVFLIDADYGIQELFPRGRPALLAPDESMPSPLPFTATDSTLGTEHLLTLVVPAGSGSLTWLGQPPLRTRGVQTRDLARALQNLMFGTRGVSVRVNRGGDVRVGLRSWQTTWGAIKPPAAWPREPLPLPAARAATRSAGPLPDPWALRNVAALRDPATGRADVLLGGGGRPEIMLFDLDGGADVADAALAQLADPRTFDAELALVFEAGRRIAYYDSDDDGTFDLALIDDDDDALADGELTLTAGSWIASASTGRPWLRVSNLESLLRGRDQRFENRALARVAAVLR